jgi:nitroreductase
MDIGQAIRDRRSIRKFSDKKVSSLDIIKLIEAANNAPSACNIQGWRFIVVTNHKILKKMVDKGAASFIAKAPLGILVLYNTLTDNVEYHDYLQSAAACIQNMLLTAHSIGLGACWVCHLPSKRELRKLFNVPHHYAPIAYVAIGHPEKVPRQLPRKKDAKSLVSINSFKFSEQVPLRFNVKLIIKRIARKVFYMLPFRKFIREKMDDMFEKRFD